MSRFQRSILGFLLALALLPTNGLATYEPLVTIGKPELRDILYSPDGRFLATLTSFYVELLDAQTYAPVIQIPVYTEGTRGRELAFSPDSSLLAIPGSEEGILIWHVDSETFLATIPVRTRAVEFSPDGKYLAYADEDSVFLWDVVQRKTVLELPGSGILVYAIAFHPNSKMLAVGYSGSRDVALWDVETGEALSYLKLKRAGYLDAMRFSHNGDRLAAVTHFVNGDPGYAVTLWDISTGDPRYWDGEFLDVVFAPGDQRLLVGGRCGNLHIIDMDTSGVEKIPAIDHLPPPNMHGSSRLERLTIHPDRSRFASLINGSRIRIWDAQDFSRLQTLYGYGWTHSSAEALYLPEVNRIVTGRGTDVLHFWDATTGELLKAVEFYGDIYDLTASSDGMRVAIAVEGTNQIWDASTAEQLAVFSLDCSPADGGLAFSPSGKCLAYIGMCGSRFWDTETGERITWEVLEKGHIDRSGSYHDLLVFSSNGTQIAAIPEKFDEQAKTVIWDFETGLPISETQYIGPVVDVGIDFLQAYKVDGTMELRLLKSNRLLSRIPGKLWEWELNSWELFWYNRFHPSGNVLAIRYDGYYREPGEYRFYSVWSGELISAVSGIWDLQFAADGSYMFLVDDEGQLGLYRTSDVIGEPVPTVFAVNPSGKKITLLGRIKQDQLMQNYPNPFNPDTWIPYQLSEASNVIIRIYTINGRLIRTQNLGYKQAGYYMSKEKAAYWDGRNESGEKVASSVYYYSSYARSFKAL